MTHKQMLKLIRAKVRYNMKTYLFFMIVTIILVALFILSLVEVKMLESNSYFTMITFMYIPILINQAIYVTEYPKCFYLVPMTPKERKKYMIFQNAVKSMISIVLDGILAIIACLVHPDMCNYFFNWFMIVGVSFTIYSACCGYNSYYVKKKKKSFFWYMLTYIATITIFSGFYLGAMVYADYKVMNRRTWSPIMIVAIIFFYFLYYRLKFNRVEPIYENINKEEKRIISFTNKNM